MNLQREMQQTQTKPERKISLELFDSPAISSRDAREFADWVNQHGLSDGLQFHYYVSKGDLVPFAGSLRSSTYLGNGLEANKGIAEVHIMQLTKEGSGQKVISALGPHGRMFFRGNEGVHYIDKQMTIMQFDKKQKLGRLANIIPKLVGAMIVWPTIGVVGSLKRLFWGRRHHPSIFAPHQQRREKN